MLPADNSNTGPPSPGSSTVSYGPGPAESSEGSEVWHRNLVPPLQRSLLPQLPARLSSLLCLSAMYDKNSNAVTREDHAENTKYNSHNVESKISTATSGVAQSSIKHRR